MNVSLLKMYFFTSKDARVRDSSTGNMLLYLRLWQCCLLVPANAILNQAKGPNSRPDRSTVLF